MIKTGQKFRKLKIIEVVGFLINFQQFHDFKIETLEKWRLRPRTAKRIMKTVKNFPNFCLENSIVQADLLTPQEMSGYVIVNAPCKKNSMNNILSLIICF